MTKDISTNHEESTVAKPEEPTPAQLAKLQIVAHYLRGGWNCSGNNKSQEITKTAIRVADMAYRGIIALDEHQGEE